MTISRASIVEARETQADAAAAMMNSKHSYTMPSVLAIPALERGNSDYLAWLRGRPP